MSSDRLLDAIIIGLITTSVAASIAAVHFYQLSLESPPPVPDVDNQIGKLGMGFFDSGNATFGIDYAVDILRLNSTYHHR